MGGAGEKRGACQGGTQSPEEAGLEQKKGEGRKGDQGQGRFSFLQVKLGRPWWGRWEGWGTQIFFSVMGTVGVGRLLLAKLTAKVAASSRAESEKGKQERGQGD